MDNKKFEQLIDLIINENEEQARALFHDIVVEKSREIYESMMDEEMSEDDSMEGTQVGSLLDEISADEEGMTEEEEDLEFDDEEEVVMGDDDEEMGDDDMDSEEDLEDRVVDLEDKLDQLMAEFESIMSDEEGEMGDEMSGEEGEEDMDMDMEAGEEEESEEMMEAVQLQKVSVTHGDNGSNTKTPVAANSGARGMASKPVSMGHGAESVPTSPKAPSNAYAKGETQVKGAGQFKNAPGHKSQDLDSAPKPKHGDDGANTKSPVAESRKVTKKRV
jgi:hypothetical protein